MLRLKEIWKDPVWSKVIAQGIISLLVLTGVLGSRMPLLEALNIKIEIYWVLIAFTVLLIFNKLLSTIRASRSQVSKTEQAIRDSIIRQKEIVWGDTTWEWTTVFCAGLKFEIQDLTAYCNKHTPKMKFVKSAYELRCPVCDSSFSYGQFDNTESIIISKIQHEIDNLKSSE